MRAILLAAVIVAAIPAGAARAGTLCPSDWWRRAETFVHSLLAAGNGGNPKSREVIVPPAGIDPKMAFAPPRPLGTMRIITPPETTGKRP